MKKFLTFLYFVVIFFLSVNNLYSWSIHCQNGSCVAINGSVKVYWTAPVSNWKQVNALTGVEGLPISTEDYKNIEQKISTAIEKSIPLKKKDKETDKKTEENLFIESKNTLTKQKLGNYNLLLIKWLGDTAGKSLNGIEKYLGATEVVFTSCMEGKIDPIIKAFFVAQNANVLDNLDLRTELNEDNKYLILTKYYGLTRLTHILDPQTRYSEAASVIAGIATGRTLGGDTAESLSKEFKENIPKLNLLMESGQTALDLYKSGYKDLAFAKWYADKNLLKEHINKMPLPDKYISAIMFVDAYKKGKEYIQDIIKTKPDAAAFILLTDELYKNFESAISKEDDSVKIVTVERKTPIYIMAIPFLIVLAVLGVFIFKKISNSRKQE